MGEAPRLPLSAAEIARAVRTRQLSASEVLEASISRIEARDPSLNAFVFTDFERARRRAAIIDAEIASGGDPGPLAGVPTAIKDLGNTVTGWPSTAGGIRALKDARASAFSNYPQKTEQSGAIVLGMTNSPVFGFRGVTDNPLFGATGNPFDVRRSAGGSSGGSAAAVADGMLPVANANDGGGSIRIPAAWSGVYGFQPSFGRVPIVVRPNAFDMVSPFIFEGVVSRTVEDAALIMQSIAGYDPADPWSIPGDVDWIGSSRGTVKGKRIGYCHALGGAPVDRRIHSVMERAIEAFSIAGAEIIPIEIDFGRSHEAFVDIWLQLIGTRMAGLLDIFKAGGYDVLGHSPQDLPDPILAWVEKGRRMNLADVQDSQRARTQIFDGFARAFADVDLIVTPTVGALPTELTPGRSDGPGEIEGIPVDPAIGWVLTFYTNMTGHPAASVPAGLADGLPVGLQIIGRRYADADVLAASSAFEAVRPWHHLYRICEGRLHPERSLFPNSAEVLHSSGSGAEAPHRCRG